MIEFPKVKTDLPEVEADTTLDFRTDHPIDQLAIGIIDIDPVETVADLPSRAREGTRVVILSLKECVIAMDNKWTIFNTEEFWKPINLNTRVRFKLIPDRVDPEDLPSYWKPNELGYIETEFHDFIRTLGKYAILGANPVVENNSIEISLR